MSKVSLLDYTENAEYLAAYAAHICYSETSKINLTPEEVEALLRKVIKAGHLSVIEHANYTFLIEGVSRVTTHQLVRHRLASYSQQSHRYTKVNSFACPPDLLHNQKALEIYNESIDNAIWAYNKLIALGIKKEDARYIVPQAVTSNIVVTMNAREVRHFLRLRLSKRAQWEIREIANEMLTLVKKVSPILFEDIKEGKDET